MQRALLRRFADDEQFLIAHQRDGQERRISTKQASTVRDFYGFIGASGALDLRVESAMAGRMESSFPALRDLLEKEGTITGDSKKEFDRYVAYALCRTRTVRDYMDQMEVQLLDTVILAEYAHRFRLNVASLNPLSRRALVALGHQDLAAAPSDDGALRRLRTFIRTAESIVDKLRHLHWRHVTLGGSEVAITSDSAVAVLRAGTGGGLLPAKTPVVIPLGPASLAVGAPRRSLMTVSTSPDLVARSNKVMAMTAHTQCFRHPDTPWPTDLILDPDPLPVSVMVSTSSGPKRVSRGSSQAPSNASSELKSIYSDPKLSSFARDLLGEMSQGL